MIPFTGGAEGREAGGHSKCHNRPEVKKCSSKLGPCLLGSASLFELERMWKGSRRKPLFLLLLKEPDGTAGPVDGLEVGLGSLAPATGRREAEAVRRDAATSTLKP